MTENKIVSGLRDALAGRCTYDTVGGRFEQLDMDAAIALVNGWLPQPVTARDALVLRDRIAAALYTARQSK